MYLTFCESNEKEMKGKKLNWGNPWNKVKVAAAPGVVVVVVTSLLFFLHAF
jgi:hypothetical protein